MAPVTPRVLLSQSQPPPQSHALIAPLAIIGTVAFLALVVLAYLIYKTVRHIKQCRVASSEASTLEMAKEDTLAILRRDGWPFGNIDRALPQAPGKAYTGPVPALVVRPPSAEWAAKVAGILDAYAVLEAGNTAGKLRRMAAAREEANESKSASDTAVASAALGQKTTKAEESAKPSPRFSLSDTELSFLQQETVAGIAGVATLFAIPNAQAETQEFDSPEARLTRPDIPTDEDEDALSAPKRESKAENKPKPKHNRAVVTLSKALQPLELYACDVAKKDGLPKAGQPRDMRLRVTQEGMDRRMREGDDKVEGACTPEVIEIAKLRRAGGDGRSNAGKAMNAASGVTIAQTMAIRPLNAVSKHGVKVAAGPRPKAASISSASATPPTVRKSYSTAKRRDSLPSASASMGSSTVFPRTPKTSVPPRARVRSTASASMLTRAVEHDARAVRHRGLALGPNVNGSPARAQFGTLLYQTPPRPKPKTITPLPAPATKAMEDERRKMAFAARPAAAPGPAHRAQCEGATEPSFIDVKPAWRGTAVANVSGQKLTDT